MRNTFARPLLVAILLALAAAAAAGCGAAEDGAATRSNPASADSPAPDLIARRRDAAAKSAVRQLTVQVESCAVAASYEQCDSAGGLLTTGNSMAVATGNRSGYTVEARSQSGSVFRLTRDTAGVFRRSCEPAGNGGCRRGRW